MRCLGLNGLGISSFAMTAGETECLPEDIPGFAGLWHSLSPDREFSTMGSGAYRKMTRPIGE